MKGKKQTGDEKSNDAGKGTLQCKCRIAMSAWSEADAECDRWDRG